MAIYSPPLPKKISRELPKTDAAIGFLASKTFRPVASRAASGTRILSGWSHSGS